MRKNEYHILVIGAGVPGLSLAILASRLGLNVAIADKIPAPALKDTKPDGRTAALMQGSVNILRATGAWEACKSYGEELQTLRIVDDAGIGKAAEPVTVNFQAHEIGLEAFGINMPGAPLRAALAEQVGKSGKIAFIKAALKDYNVDDFGLTAHFDNGDEIRAKLIVGADGRNSVTRQIAGIDAWNRDYGQDAITCLVNHELPHDNISTEFHRPSGPFTLVPLPGKQSSLVWVDFKPQVEEYMAMSKHALERAINDRSRNMLGQITLETTPQSCPLHALKAKTLTAKRTALIAEAAHVLHPMGAQGLNLSLRDVAALAEVIADAVRIGLDPGSRMVLEQYDRRRRHDILGRVIGTDGLTRIVSNHYGLLRKLRRAGLKTLDNITPLKEFTMQQGLAPQDCDGRLAAGQRL